MQSPATAKQLVANKQLAQDLGIQGTPTLVIGQKIVEGLDQSKAVVPMSTGAR